MEFPIHLSYPEDRLSDLLPEVHVNVIGIEEEVLRTALFNYLALTYFPNVALGDAEISEIELLYNRYYWFLKVARGQQRRHGPDAGMDQQAFQILEHAGIEFDWDEVQKIEQRVASEIEAETY